ncbi:MAG: type 1 glutamine amidotransferase [Pseudomonadota bacterium]
MQIGILMCGHVPEDYRQERGDLDQLFVALLQGRGFTFRTWSVVDMDFPSGADDADGWLITGSKHGVYDDLPFIAPLEELVRDIHAARRPLVGICFGHQIIAQALGGRVEKFQGGWNIGLQHYELDGKPVTLNAWHQDQIIELPNGAEVLGSNESCRYAMVRYGPETLSVQAHPEFDSAYLGTLIEARAGQVPEDKRAEATANLHAPTDREMLAEMLADTLRQKAPV